MMGAGAGVSDERPAATSEGSGRKPQEYGVGASNVTARKESPWTEAKERLMEEVVSRGNMMAALNRVASNKGAPGIDGMTTAQLRCHLKEKWPAIREELLKGRYQPAPVWKVEIPKPSGGTRTLGIPTVLDRLIQQALYQVLLPLFNPDFSESSYGFRPGRSAHQAVQAARRHVAEGRRWVVDIDLEKFFDRVNHDILMSRVVRKVKDRRVPGLIRRYLQGSSRRRVCVAEGGRDAPGRPPLTASVEHPA
jgi:RNA-directed DNA polymerase